MPWRRVWSERGVQSKGAYSAYRNRQISLALYEYRIQRPSALNLASCTKTRSSPPSHESSYQRARRARLAPRIWPQIIDAVPRSLRLAELRRPPPSPVNCAMKVGLPRQPAPSPPPSAIAAGGALARARQANKKRFALPTQLRRFSSGPLPPPPTAPPEPVTQGNQGEFQEASRPPPPPPGAPPPPPPDEDGPSAGLRI